MVKGVCGCNLVDDNEDASRTTPEKRCREKHEEKKRPFGEAWMLRSHLGTCSILHSESIAYNSINKWHECKDKLPCLQLFGICTVQHLDNTNL